jgi:ectoine hydroxylase-related dioxygenase (phytanoyl-CoA dioxygenase family)
MADVGLVSVPLTERDVLFFRGFGFLVLRGLFADEIVEITAAFDEVFATQGAFTMRWPGYRFRDRHGIGDFVERHPRLHALATDARLVTIATTLLGADAHAYQSDGSIYCCETEWHYDTATEAPNERHMKFAFYLEPLDEANGAPRVLPISHHDPELYMSGPLQPYLGFDGAIEQRTGVAGERLPYYALPTAPGDVLAWDFRLLHASYGTNAPRRALGINFRTGT